MKIFIISAKRWLGPKTPHTGIVKEEDEIRAIEAFMDPLAVPFSQEEPTNFKWYPRYKPSPDDFSAKCIGFDNVWPIRFSEEIRLAAIEKLPAYSSEETAFLLFLKDRIIIRLYTEGSAISSFFFEVKLAMADFFFSIASMIGDKAKPKIEIKE